MSTPAHAPTDKSRRTVKMLSAFGLRHDDISAILEICDVTLRKHYARELAAGLPEANAQVASNLFKIATGDDKSACVAAIFWLKTRARWRTSDVDALMSELEELRTKLQLAEERLTRLGLPKLVA